MGGRGRGVPTAFALRSLFLALSYKCCMHARNCDRDVAGSELVS